LDGISLRRDGYDIPAAEDRSMLPLFDVNPIPSGDRLSLNVSEYDNSIDLSLATEVAEYFGLTKDEARNTSAAICETVNKNWVRIAERYSLSRGAVEYMRPAFSLY